MIACLLGLSLLLLADGAVTISATELPGLGAAVLCWIIAYPALLYTWPEARNGLRWSVIFLGITVGVVVDFVVLQQPFQWFAAVTLVVAAGHFAGWSEAIQLLLSRGRESRQPPPRHGRPGTFTVALAASFILAYLCQSPASGLTTRTGLFASFAAVALGFAVWELGRSNRSRQAPTTKKNPAHRRMMRWIGAALLGLLAFFVFVQVLPLAAARLSDPTPLEVSAKNLDLPDVPDLDGTPDGDSDNQGAASLPSGETVGQLPSGLSQEGTGRETENLPGQSDRASVGSVGEAGTRGPVTDGSQTDASLEDEWTEFDKPPPTQTAISSPIEPGDSFWEVPPVMIWPFLILVVLAGLVGLLVLWFTQTSTDSSEDDGDGPASRKPFWEDDTTPGYLRDFFARSAGLGYEKERGHTLLEFLRLLRRVKVTRNEFDDLRTYHYDVQFENKPRDTAAERNFRRKAKEWLP
jgi:hypothetical protein